jgi:hypothetical protein
MGPSAKLIKIQKPFVEQDFEVDADFHDDCECAQEVQEDYVYPTDFESGEGPYEESN